MPPATHEVVGEGVFLMGKYQHAKRTKQRAHHSWITVRLKGPTGFPWPICQACGLVKLKNAATEAAIKARCDAMDEE